MIQPSANPQAVSSPGSKSRGRKSAKAPRSAVKDKPVQLTFFDYAARIGFALLPEAS